MTGALTRAAKTGTWSQTDLRELHFGAGDIYMVRTVRYLGVVKRTFVEYGLTFLRVAGVTLHKHKKHFRLLSAISVGTPLFDRQGNRMTWNSRITPQTA